MVSPRKTVFIVSDSTGETAYHLLQTVLAQFKNDDVSIKRFLDITSAKQIQAIVDEINGTGGLIFHSLVSPGLREAVGYLSASRGIPCVDVLGAPIEQLAIWLGQQPRYKAGVTRTLDMSYSKRVMALEYALLHDDGNNPSGLSQADLVLVGVSRTAKTPISIYLAFRSWLVGNVPIVEGVEPPSILFDLPKEKVIALTVHPDRLVTLRHARGFQVDGANSYDDLDEVRREVRHALMLYDKAGWQVIDMTYKTIEEATDEIGALVNKRIPLP